jgi:large subunit ribosomal protein L4
MELKVINENGKAGKSMDASDDLFGREYNEALVHQLVVAYQANARSANSKQKGRSEINKTTHKPFAQKGTGRARAGRASSPLWRGGGKIFPNLPDQIFSKLVSEGRLSVLDALSVDAPKTKLLAAKINDMGLKDARVMIITDSIDENMYLASRNLPNVLVVEVHQADPVSLVRFPNVLVTRSAIAKIEEMLA